MPWFCTSCTLEGISTVHLLFRLLVALPHPLLHWQHRCHWYHRTTSLGFSVDISVHFCCVSFVLAIHFRDLRVHLAEHLSMAAVQQFMPAPAQADPFFCLCSGRHTQQSLWNCWTWYGLTSVKHPYLCFIYKLLLWQRRNQPESFIWTNYKNGNRTFHPMTTEE